MCGSRLFFAELPTALCKSFCFVLFVFFFIRRRWQQMTLSFRHTHHFQRGSIVVVITFNAFMLWFISLVYLFKRWTPSRILLGALKRRPRFLLLANIIEWWITVTLRLRCSGSIWNFFFFLADGLVFFFLMKKSQPNAKRVKNAKRNVERW